MKTAGLLAVLLLAALQLAAGLPVTHYGLNSNVQVNFYTAESYDDSDCFISLCDDDVSIVQSIDPNFGTCGSAVTEGPIVSFSPNGEANILFSGFISSAYSTDCTDIFSLTFNNAEWLNFVGGMNNRLVINWIESVTKTNVEDNPCPCLKNPNDPVTTTLNLLTLQLCNSSCAIIPVLPTPSPSPSPVPVAPTPTPVFVPTPTPTVDPLCPTPQETQACLDRTVFNNTACAQVDDCTCLTGLMALDEFNCNVASDCFCNKIIDFTNIPFCVTGDIPCQACESFTYPDNCSSAGFLSASVTLLLAALLFTLF